MSSTGRTASSAAAARRPVRQTQCAACTRKRLMELLQGILGLYAQRADWFAGLLQAHIGLALTAIAMSGMIGLLTGIWIAEHPRIAPPVMGVCNVLYTIPAISLLGILIPFSGIGNKTAVIALTVYGITTPTWDSPHWTRIFWRQPGAWAVRGHRRCFG